MVTCIAAHQMVPCVVAIKYMVTCIAAHQMVPCVFDNQINVRVCHYLSNVN